MSTQLPIPSADPTSQILIKLGEMSTQLAVMQKTLEAIPDHESRIRALERFRFTIAGASVFGGALSGFVGYWLGHLIK